MNKTLRFSEYYNQFKPIIMGIINITPDSFFKGSRCNSYSELNEKIDFFVENSVPIIDFGACSTRPNATFVSENEEMDRLFPVLEYVRSQYPDLFISVDTFRGNVAKKAIEEYQVDVINDVFAFEQDPTMLDVLSSLSPTYVLTHCAKVNHANTDIMTEIIRFFAEKLSILHGRGITDVILDPGYGFGKTMEQNFTLLQHQGELLQFGLPILSGLSRKRMVWETLNSSPEQALNGTTVLNTIALLHGTSILRVHDVKEAMETVKLISACSQSETFL